MQDKFIRELHFAAFDTETTGLQPVADRIVEIAAVRFGAGGEEGRWSRLVQPGCPIPPRATAIHGISDGMVAGERKLDGVLPEFLEFVHDAVLVAHNAAFDVGFVAYGISTAGLKRPKNVILDSCRLARALVPALPNYRLETLAAHFKVGPAQDHRALSDSLLCMKVFHSLLRILDPGPATPFSKLAQAHGPPLSLSPEIAAGGQLDLAHLPIQRAIEEGRTIAILYGRKAEAAVSREITPYAVSEQSGGIQIDAYCHLRRERRLFRLDRILKIEGT